MQRLTIRRFDVMRTANVIALLYAAMFAVLGLVFLVPFALVGIASSTNGNGGIAAVGLAGGLFFYVLAIAFYTVVAWIGTIIVLAFYNFAAGRVGGVRFVVDVEAPTGGYPGYPATYPGAAYAPPIASAPGYPAPTPGYPAPTPSWQDPNAPGHGTGPALRADPPGNGAPPAPPA